MRKRYTSALHQLIDEGGFQIEILFQARRLFCLQAFNLSRKTRQKSATLNRLSDTVMLSGEQFVIWGKKPYKGVDEMTTTNAQISKQLDRNQWVRIGLAAAVASIVAVLIVQAAAIAIWPDIALFKPLDSYARTVLFTLIPALGATALFAWLSRRKADPVPAFLKISAVVLVLSIIPDYLLPVEYKTLLASSVTAFMHVVAAAVIVSVLVIGYRRQTSA